MTGNLCLTQDSAEFHLGHSAPDTVVTGNEQAGIFAVGDVRSGSVKRVAAAIGEGSVAVRLAFERHQSAGTADPIGLAAR